MKEWRNDEGLENKEGKDFVYHPPPLRDDNPPPPTPMPDRVVIIKVDKKE